MTNLLCGFLKIVTRGCLCLGVAYTRMLGVAYTRMSGQNQQKGCLYWGGGDLVFQNARCSPRHSSQICWIKFFGISWQNTKEYLTIPGGIGCHQKWSGWNWCEFKFLNLSCGSPSGPFPPGGHANRASWWIFFFQWPPQNFLCPQNFDKYSRFWPFWVFFLGTKVSQETHFHPSTQRRRKWKKAFFP